MQRLLINVLFTFLVLYLIHYIASFYHSLKTRKIQKFAVNPHKKVKYDEKEWQKIKNELEK